MNKIDYKQVFKECYLAKAGQAMLVDVPPMQFLILEDCGDPLTPSRFEEAVKCLSSLAHAVRSILKNGLMALDFATMPLELLSSADDMDALPSNGDQRRWTPMIMQPPVVDSTLVDEAKLNLQRKKKCTPLLSEIRLSRFEEGKVVQLLHTGRFSETGVQRLREFAAAQGYRFAGKRHEIYLSDARRTSPERLRTLLRHPVAPLT